MSALHGDNVVDRSDAMPWYAGPPLLYHLEHVVIATDRNLVDVRLPIQWVVRPIDEAHHDYRGYSGQVAAGVLRPGDEVMLMPSGQTTRIAAIDTYDGELEAAFPTMSITLRFADQLDVSRGDMVVNPDDPPVAGRELDAMVCWMGTDPIRPGARYALKQTTRTVRAVVDALEYRVDVNTLAHVDAPELTLNEIGRVKLRTSAPVMVDRYRRNRTVGSFILIDEASGDTVGAGMVVHASSR
jgi:sulfate adenylyltransferase subunit 1 (EFTu-like GTPase family)